jgi:hypothetical protein
MLVMLAGYAVCYLLRWLCWLSLLSMLAMMTGSARYISWNFYAGCLTLFLCMLAGYDCYAGYFVYAN